MSTITFDLPEDVIALLGSPEAAAAKAKEALVLSLLRQRRIGHGRAAQFLGLSIWDMLDLMAQYQIPTGPQTIEELQQEVAEFRHQPSETP
jgi:predicted HTH domain antitoxin